MDKFYYLVAQLPQLSFSRKNDITERQFLDEARKWLSKKDYTTVRSVQLDGTAPFKKGPRVWQAYRSFEAAFRNELAQWRSANRNRGAEFKPSVFPVSLVKEGDPLAVEKKLLQFRWEYIDAMEKSHHFDIDSLILYFLKLQILSRLSCFDKEKGQEVFKKLIEENPNPPNENDAPKGDKELETVDKDRA